MIIRRIVLIVIIAKLKILEFQAGGILEVIPSDPYFMPRGIKQPAQGHRAGRVRSRDLLLDCRMSQAVQPYRFSVLLPEGLVPTASQH